MRGGIGEEELTYRESYNLACQWNVRLLLTCCLLLVIAASFCWSWWQAETELRKYAPRPTVWRKS